MQHSIKNVYVIHHSHTDIGYTDLQERIVAVQVEYIRKALRLMDDPANADFRWNCETLFCVEKFFEQASEEEQQKFLALARAGKIGLSANYLNFTGLLDCGVYGARLAEWKQRFAAAGIDLHTAMCADINGLSMGMRDAMLDNGIEFLFTNIHCHHGMYPLYQNQTAYRWQSADGRSLLVWNGEHYNLGNVLGIRPNVAVNFMIKDRLGDAPLPKDDAEALRVSLDKYLTECEENGYPYDFIPSSVSGVFSDNAPPEPLILRTIEAYNALNTGVTIRMVSLQEFYDLVRAPLADAPVYTGDLTDWWDFGAGSTPFAVQHYLEARRNYELCGRLDPDFAAREPALDRRAQDNLLLFAEHTFGHSATVSAPYEPMVQALDLRKNSYASQAHESAATILSRIAQRQGDILNYYGTEGAIRVVSPSDVPGPQPVEFYIETMAMPDAWVKNEAGEEIPCQVSAHPRGRRISFVDTFAAHESKTYTYGARPAKPELNNTRKCYVGAERVRDIISDYDPVTYRLPYGFENRWFRLSYHIGLGVTEFYDKIDGCELLTDGPAPFFTPVYENTPVDPALGPDAAYETRRLMGRNTRGVDAVQVAGRLEKVECRDHGPIFTTLALHFALPGTVHCIMVLKLYEALPRIDFSLELGKTMSVAPESVYLPLSLAVPDHELWVRKGGREAYRPGVDQLPGTCMDFTATDDGIVYTAPDADLLIASYDVPLVSFGELEHHPIRLCDGDPQNDQRPVWSWIMNNNWETNFNINLSGFGTFRYTLWRVPHTSPEQAMDALHERMFAPAVRIIK